MPGMEQAVEASFDGAARRRERTLAVVRMVACVVLFARTALIWHFAFEAMCPMLIATVLCVVGSLAVTRSSGPIERMLWCSVMLDTTVAFTALQGRCPAAAAAMAIALSLRTRKLAEGAARAARTAGRARRNFAALLHDHHDVRTLLAAVRLHADRLAGARRGGAGHAIDDLRSDLDDVEARIHAIYARACGELSALDARRRVDVAAIAREVLERLACRFPGAALVIRGQPHVEAEVAGGGATVRRLLLNLVVNACEGDGERGAMHVEVTVRGDRRAQRIWIEVADDGPGFAPDLLDAAPDEVRSTKPGGSGFGLAIVRALAEASDGTLACGNRASGGAWVSLSLPIAR